MVHVAGTNGKGSVCAMVAEILRRQGFRVGLYTSPHLQRVNERIKIDGREISDQELEGLLQLVAGESAGIGCSLVDLREHERALTYFELLTAVAFMHFAERNVDVAVVEVGMGGRLDATSVGKPLVGAITSIGLDHTDELGPDVASIAGEKAGILRPGLPVAVGGVPAEARRVIRAIAQARDARLFVYGEDFHLSRDGASFIWQGPGTVRSGLGVGLEGTHQVDNAAVSLAIVDLLPMDLTCEDEAIREGIAEVRVPGRLEWVAPDVLVDSAHNLDGAVTLAAYLRGRPARGRRTLLLGCSREKDIRAMGAMLAPHVDRIFTTACAHPRALAPGRVAAALESLAVPVMPAGPIEQALPLARGPEQEVVVSGSVFLVGAVRELLGLP